MFPGAGEGGSCRQLPEPGALGSAGNDESVFRIVIHTKFDNPAGQWYDMPELIKKKCSPDGKLTRADLKDIAEAKEDIKAGRVHTPEQVRKNLGL